MEDHVGHYGEKQTSSDSGGFTADEFASFFVDKVEAVRQSTSSTPLHHVSETAAHTTASWEPVTPDDVVKLISKRAEQELSTRCSTDLVGEAVSGTPIAPFISRLFNKSLATGCFPKLMKHAVVVPIIKKGSQDSTQLKSYRPVLRTLHY